MPRAKPRKKPQPPSAGKIYRREQLEAMGIKRLARQRLIAERVIAPVQVGQCVWYSGRHLVEWVQRRTDEIIASLHDADSQHDNPTDAGSPDAAGVAAHADQRRRYPVGVASVPASESEGIPVRAGRDAGGTAAIEADRAEPGRESLEVGRDD